MRLGRWLSALRGSGAPEDLDPAEPVEVAIVPLPEGPLMVSALQATGIRAVGFEASSGRAGAIRTWNRMRILVPRGAADAATALLEELRGS